MNLTNLSNEELHSNTVAYAKQERESMTAVLCHLKEVNARRLYSEKGCDSIFSYAVRELKYSEAAAARRVNAMRVLDDVPEVASKIENGSLTLSAVSSAQSFFKKEAVHQGKKYTPTEKREVLSAMINKSSQECEKILVAISPDSAVKRDLAKPVTENLSELRFNVDQQTLEKFEKLLSLLSHQNHSGSYGKNLELICEIALDKLDPVRKEVRIQARAKKTSDTEVEVWPVQAQGAHSQRTTVLSKINSASELNLRSSSTPTEARYPGGLSAKLGYIPAPLRRQVLIRDRYRCQFVNPETGEICGSSWQVEPDHLVATALGGATTLENLSARCRNHNLWNAVKSFGAEKMSKYIRVAV